MLFKKTDPKKKKAASKSATTIITRCTAGAWQAVGGNTRGVGNFNGQKASRN